jgi:thioesterase domain-containing protein
MDTSFLLLPGGGMSSWVWTKLIPLLRGPCITPEYRIEKNTYENRIHARIEDCVQYHVKLVQDRGIGKIVVVGHSGAGALAAAIAKEIPDRIVAVVYVSANLPKNHETTLDALPWALKLMNRMAIKAQVKNESQSMKKNENMIRKMFCNLSDEATIKYILEQKVLSEPLCLAFEKYNYDAFPEIRQVYIKLTRDKTQSVRQQDIMIGNMSIGMVKEIESDHMVMLSHAEELAKVLNEEMGI